MVPPGHAYTTYGRPPDTGGCFLGPCTHEPRFSRLSANIPTNTDGVTVRVQLTRAERMALRAPRAHMEARRVPAVSSQAVIDKGAEQ